MIHFFPLCALRCTRGPDSSFPPCELENKWQLFLSRRFKDRWLDPRVTTVKGDQMNFLMLNTDVTKLESNHFDLMCPSCCKTNKTLCSSSSLNLCLGFAAGAHGIDSVFWNVRHSTEAVCLRKLSLKKLHWEECTIAFFGDCTVFSIGQIFYFSQNSGGPVVF